MTLQEIKTRQDFESYASDHGMTSKQLRVCLNRIGIRTYWMLHGVKRREAEAIRDEAGLRTFALRYSIPIRKAYSYAKHYCSYRRPRRASIHDWNSVDWSLKNTEIARRLRCSRSMVGERRKRHDVEREIVA